MVDVDLVTAKLGQLEEHVERVRRHRPASEVVLASDRDAFDLVCFNLLLAVQTCLDIASHLIADEGWPPARSLAGAFERLREEGVLEAETTAALQRAAGLRNVVVHLYQRTDPAKVFQASGPGLEDLERFATEVASWVRRAPG